MKSSVIKTKQACLKQKMKTQTWKRELNTSVSPLLRLLNAEKTNLAHLLLDEVGLREAAGLKVTPAFVM